MSEHNMEHGPIMQLENTTDYLQICLVEGYILAALVCCLLMLLLIEECSRGE